MKTPEQIWEEIECEAKKVEHNPELRLCSQCLCAVPRLVYDTHLINDHNFEILNVCYKDVKDE